MSGKIAILLAADVAQRHIDDLNEAFDVHVLPGDAKEADALLDAKGTDIRGIAVLKTPITKELIDRLPNLELISSYSAGIENIDTGYVRERGIAIANTSHILAEEVANLTLALALCVTRNMMNGHLHVRGGHWPTGEMPLTRSLGAMNVGIVGMGHIGAAVAKRLECIGARIAYSGPRPKPVDYPYHANARDLAAASDMLIVTCPLLPETVHLIDAEVLDALGPDGYVVNVARGPIIDEKALIATLEGNRIAGAALDVFETEPNVPEALRTSPRVVLAPHIGSATVETRQAMGDAMVDALVQHFGVTITR
ncbi:2-hydroxyacid dehydrogenase [Pelagibacterium xiamenense]|uniref:2-hydroxyacid dehydrogenase n=1 Tax=Pelagibacterium xiamenense TaxID=2901140 RepID=UPI001E58A991|nr:2-hydroxyacid dehydrogenase [Pelagibacterium xiamenense]MCD7060678.1 2-hydroxyacid dehydrogenase [Pelagibacterium xiamenense]